MKASIHTQSDHEIKDIRDEDNLPIIRKIGLLMNRMRRNCRRHYWPGPDIAYDEISLLICSRSQYKKQLRFKPVGERIQLLAFCESKEGSQYCYDFELDRCTGEKDVVSKGIKRMVLKLPPGSKNYRIAADNYFNSIKTTKDVQAMGHQMYGTMRSNMGVPAALKNFHKHLKEKGDSCFATTQQGGITVTCWKNSKIVTAVSSVHPPAIVTAHRRMKGRAERQELPCPLVFSEYNMWMGAIDDVDRLMSFHSVRLRSNKWWHTLFYFILDLCAINAFHLWKIKNPEEAETTTSCVWIAGLVEEILAAYGEREGQWLTSGKRRRGPGEDVEERPDASAGGHGGSHLGKAKAATVLGCSKRLVERHFPDKAEKRGNCALCYANHPNSKGEEQVVWMCPDCNVCLHVPECFKEWHTRTNPVSPFVPKLD